MEDRFKFRIGRYNPVLEKWTYISADFITIDGTAMPYNDGEGGSNCVYDDCIIEQCTGLKDKNNKLIYEGDIVYSPVDGGTQKVIYWDNRLASFMAYNRYPDKHYTQRIGNGYFIELDFEVVGNIHENPELLGEE